MLTDKMAIATFTVSDLDRAIKFYTEKVGLKFVRKSEGDANLEAGMGSMIDIYLKPNSATENTVVTFMVDDLEAEIEALKGKGVVFEEYDIPGMGIKTENGIARMGETMAAWFKDTEGNIVAIFSMKK